MNFKELAQKELSLSPLMSGREQLKSEEINGKTLTLREFDFVSIVDHGTEKVYPVCIFDEYPDRYYNGGMLLYKLCNAFAAEFGGDVEAASNALFESGGVTLRFKNAKTRNGNNITTIEAV